MTLQSTRNSVWKEKRSIAFFHIWIPVPMRDLHTHIYNPFWFWHSQDLVRPSSTSSFHYIIVNSFSCTLYFWPSFASTSVWLSHSFSSSPHKHPSRSFLCRCRQGRQALPPPQIRSLRTRWTRLHIPATRPHAGVAAPVAHPHKAMALLPWARTHRMCTPVLLTPALSTTKAIIPSSAFTAASLLLESFVTSKVVGPVIAQAGFWLAITTCPAVLSRAMPLCWAGCSASTHWNSFLLCMFMLLPIMSFRFEMKLQSHSGPGLDLIAQKSPAHQYISIAQLPPQLKGWKVTLITKVCTEGCITLQPPQACSCTAEGNGRALPGKPKFVHKEAPATSKELPCCGLNKGALSQPFMICIV